MSLFNDLCGSFNDAVSNSGYVASNVRLITESLISKDVEGNGRGVIGFDDHHLPGRNEEIHYSRESNRAQPQFKAETLPLEPTCSAC
jgi:hypothetical protein